MQMRKHDSVLEFHTGIGARRWSVYLPLAGDWTGSRWIRELATRGPYAHCVFDVCEEAERDTGRPCVWERGIDRVLELKSTAEMRAWYRSHLAKQIGNARKAQAEILRRARASVRFNRRAA